MRKTPLEIFEEEIAELKRVAKEMTDQQKPKPSYKLETEWEYESFGELRMKSYET